MEDLKKIIIKIFNLSEDALSEDEFLLKGDIYQKIANLTNLPRHQIKKILYWHLYSIRCVPKE